MNECLHAGPPLSQLIFDIMLRFRSHRVALVGDIEKAFLMVHIAEEDRDVLRFLWVKDIDKAEPEVVVLRFSRVEFGLSSSPFLLNATVTNAIYKLFCLRDSRHYYADQYLFVFEYILL